MYYIRVLNYGDATRVTDIPVQCLRLYVATSLLMSRTQYRCARVCVRVSSART